MTFWILLTLGSILLWIWSARRESQTVRASADALLKINDQLYGQVQRMEVAHARTFPEVDLARYAAAQAEFESLGYIVAGDVEDVTVRQLSPQIIHRTFLRFLAHRDGAVSVGLYDLRLRGFWQLLAVLPMMLRRFFAIDLETEFTGNYWVATGNAKRMNKSAPVPGIELKLFGEKATVAEMMENHLQRMRAAQAAGYVVVPSRTLPEILAAQERMQLHKNRFKHGAQGLAADIESVGGDKHGLADEVRRRGREE